MAARWHLVFNMRGISWAKRRVHPARARLAATALVLLLLIGLAGASQAEPNPALEQGAVYRLTAAELMAIADPAQTQGVTLSEAGLALVAGSTGGSYVSQPIRMQEFSTLTLSLDYSTAQDGVPPTVSVSVFRQQELAWGDWIAVPEGETAGRARGDAKTVLLRYRIDLATGMAMESPQARGLLVTAGQPLLTRGNVTLIIVMVCAFVFYIYRKKAQRSGAAK